MFSKTTLENGLKIITHEQPGVESVYVDVEVSAGSKYCPPGKEGLAHFVEHMVMNGTKNYPSPLDVRRAIESLGGVINAFTGKESVDYIVKVLYKDLEKAAEVIFPLTTSPLLSESEIPGEQKIILEEIAQRQDHIGKKVSDASFKLIFGEHPLSHPVLGYPETISKIKNTDVVSFFRKFYAPENTVIVASGNVFHESFVELVKYYFSNKEIKPPVYSEFRYQQFGPRAVVMAEESKQANLRLLFPNSPKNLHDYLVGKSLSSLLSSKDRLFARLREKEKLVYSIGTGSNRYKDLSVLNVYGGFSYSELVKSVKVVCEELKRTKEEDIKPEELKKIKKLIEVDLLFGLETPDVWVDFIFNWNHFLGDPIEPKQFLGELEKISAGEIRKLAQKIFVPENAYLAVSHKSVTAKELEKILREGLS